MTTRRFNYTECKRIPKRAVIAAIVDDGNGPALDIDVDFSELDLPPDAEVVVEAYADWTVMRFQFGKVGALTVPEDLALAEFDSTDGIRCRVKVLGVGPQTGLILAEADAVQPSDEGEPQAGRSFVTVRPADLGSVVWKLGFDPTSPVLFVNERLEDWKSFLGNGGVRALVLPEMVRQLMHEAIERGADEEGIDWPAQCERLAAQLGFANFPTELDDEADEWVDDVVSKFARRHRLWAGVTDLFGLEDGE